MSTIKNKILSILGKVRVKGLVLAVVGAGVAAGASYLSSHPVFGPAVSVLVVLVLREADKAVVASSVAK